MKPNLFLSKLAKHKLLCYNKVMNRPPGFKEEFLHTVSYLRNPLLTMGAIIGASFAVRRANEQEAIRASLPSITEHINNAPVPAIASAVGGFIAANLLLLSGSKPNQARRNAVGLALAVGGIVNTLFETKTGLALMQLESTPDAVDAAFGTIASGAAALAVVSADKLDHTKLFPQPSVTPDNQAVPAYAAEPGVYYARTWQPASEQPAVDHPRSLVSDGSEQFRMVIDPSAH